MDLISEIYWAPQRKGRAGWICFKDSPSAPAVPDPTVVSNAQTASNVDTAKTQAALNRVNQYTPYGNLVYSQPNPDKVDNAGYSAASTAFADKAKQYIAANPNSGLSMDSTGKINGSQDSLVALRDAVGEGPNISQYTTPGDNQWNATVTLSPEQQKLLGTNTQIQQQLADTGLAGLGRVQDAMGKPFDTSQLSNYGGVPTGGGASLGGGAQAYNPTQGNYVTGLNGGAIQNSLGDTSSDAAVQRTINAVMSRSQPMLDRQQSALNASLANQGISLGSKAYDTAQQLQGQNANDAYQQAILAGNQEQNTLYNQALQSGQFANSAQAQDFSQQQANAQLNNSVQDTQFNQGLATNQNNNAVQQQNYAQNNYGQQQNFNQQLQSSQASDQQRQQQLQEQAYLRSLPLNELNALRSGSQVQNPNFSATPQTQVANTNTAANVFSAYGLNNQNLSNQTAANNTLTSGLFTLGAAAISDRRLKKNIERIGTYRGIGVYSFDYLWGGSHVGLMADEVEKIAPHAVGTLPSGFKFVHYGMV